MTVECSSSELSAVEECESNFQLTKEPTTKVYSTILSILTLQTRQYSAFYTVVHITGPIYLY